MSTPRTPSVDSTRSLAWLLGSFVMVAVLLESGGLATWAERLDIGPLRSVAQPTTAALSERLRQWGVGELRLRLLAGLARLQRSEPPAAAPKLIADNPATAHCDAPVVHDSALVSNLLMLGRPTVQPPLLTGWPAPIVAKTTGQHDGAATTTNLNTIAASLPAAATLDALPPVPAGQTRTVALVGDSMMAVGLSDNLLRGIARHKELRAIRAFRAGTGLSRPDTFDWMAQYPQMLGESKPDAIIVAIGANDGQSFVQDGKVLEFGSDAWVAAYRDRLNRFVDLLTKDGAQVIWIGLPPMRIAKYDARMSLINRLAYDTVSQREHVTWWNAGTLIADPQGQFREYAQRPDGSSIRLRAGDGIHLSEDGAGLLAPPLLAWLDPPTRTPAAAAAAAIAEVPTSL
jgi:lysophospholipase L1-like esterase